MPSIHQITSRSSSEPASFIQANKVSRGVRYRGGVPAIVANAGAPTVNAVRPDTNFHGKARYYYPEDIEHSVEQAHPGFRAGCSAAFAVDDEDQERLAVIQEIEPRQRRNLDVDSALQAIRTIVPTHHGLEVHAIVLAKAESWDGTLPRAVVWLMRRSRS